MQIYNIKYWNKKKLKNLIIYRGGLFTPDQAFELTVKDSIRQLAVPSLKCVDLVITELIRIVNNITEKVKNKI